MSEENKIKELVLAKRKEGKVVFATFEGLMSADLEEFVKQPAEGILYDLNRDATTVLTLFIDGEKWVNDFAVGLVITKLKEKLEAVEHRLHTDVGESADLQAVSNASADSTSQEGS